MSVKTVEKHFRTYLAKLTYAVFADKERHLNVNIKYDPLMYQTYKNICKDKKDQIDGAKSRFTVGDVPSQLMVILFGKLTNEIKNTQLDENDTIDQIIQKLEAANADCFSKFMFDMNKR